MCAETRDQPLMSVLRSHTTCFEMHCPQVAGQPRLAVPKPQIPAFLCLPSFEIVGACCCTQLFFTRVKKKKTHACAANASKLMLVQQARPPPLTVCFHVPPNTTPGA